MRGLRTGLSALMLIGIAAIAVVLVARPGSSKVLPDPPAGAPVPRGPIVTYGIPAGQARGSGFSVRVRAPGGRWFPVPTYRADVDYYSPVPASMAEFDARGPIEVEVGTPTEVLHSVRVRPRALGLQPVIGSGGRTATFTLPEPEDVVFEANGDTHRSLHLFVNQLPQRQSARPGDRVLFFGPGLHIIPGDHVLRVGSHTTLDIAGGAVLAGVVQISGSDVTVQGHGVIDPSRFFQPRDSPPTIWIRESSNVGIRDVTILESQSEGFEVRDAHNVVLAHVREINSAYQSDGIDVMASSHVLIEGAFLRTSDDSIAVYASTPWGAHGDTSDVTVRDCTLFPDVAHPVLVGTHGDPHGHNTIRGLLFERLSILDEDVPKPLYQGALAVDAGDNNTVSDVQFEDIDVEHITEGQLVNVRVFLNPDYNQAPGAGIHGILFRNITFPAGEDQPSQIEGYGPFRRVTDVRFENVTRGGRPVLDPAAGNIHVGPYTGSIHFVPATPYTQVSDRTRGSTRVTFTGTEVRLLGTLWPSGGLATLQVDARPPVSVDTYAPVAAGGQLWFDSGVLPFGRHSVRLVVLGRRDRLAVGSAVALDGLDEVH